MIFFMLPAQISTSRHERDISPHSNASESLQSAGLRHFNLDYRFCLGQRRFYDAATKSDACDSLCFGESSDQLSDSVGLGTDHLSVRANLFVAQSAPNGRRTQSWNGVRRNKLRFGYPAAGTTSKGRVWILRVADRLAWLPDSANNSVAHGTFTAKGSPVRGSSNHFLRGRYGLHTSRIEA